MLQAECPITEGAEGKLMAFVKLEPILIFNDIDDIVAMKFG